MRQIIQGAPFEVFVSAEERYIQSLFQRGLTRDQGRLYAIGRIGLFVPTRAQFAADLSDIAPAIADGRLRLIAIANPEHAPYGRAAREATQFAGLWQQMQPVLVTGENAAQAMQFALSDAVDAAIVPVSFLHAEQIAARGRFVIIPAEWHTALRQRMALLQSSSVAAESFYRFLDSPVAHKILSQYGYQLPERR